jgi:hypothetical protein
MGMVWEWMRARGAEAMLVYSFRSVWRGEEADVAR